MNNSNKLLSDLIAFRTYAKYLPPLMRRESLEETINRSMIMHLTKFPSLSKDIVKAFTLVHDLEILPSMRGLQFAGNAIEQNNARLYNCSATPIDNPRKFAEVLFLLLSGTGVGFSVQKHHIEKLPVVSLPKEEGIFFIQDSITGWSQALESLVQAYFYRSVRPIFNYSNIRAKGSPLVTTGAKAPGPEPLKIMLEAVEKRLKKSIGRKLKPIEVHDIICIISDCVLAGGIRRAALISLFDRNDNEMLTCKSGQWFQEHPYRARANNSAVLPRSEVSKEEFLFVYNKCRESGAGEPGFSWSNDKDGLFNPCHEISLSPNGFCNLVTINQTGITDKKDFLKRVYNATLIATLQASYTDFPFLSPEWKECAEREALIGISFTGIADQGDNIPDEWLTEGAKLVLEVNEKYAKKIGINLAYRTTTVKPEGTASCVLGSSSGIHSRHSKYYIRRFQISKDDTLYYYLKASIPELVEDCVYATNTAVVAIPQQSPEGAVCREQETAEDLLNRAIRYNKLWVSNGHREGENKNNVSCTISVKEEEWDKLGELMWKNRNYYSGISLLPYDNSTYQQMPFEECSQQKYEEMEKLVKVINFRDVKEMENNTNLIETIACSGGICSVEYK